MKGVGYDLHCGALPRGYNIQNGARNSGRGAGGCAPPLASAIWGIRRTFIIEDRKFRKTFEQVFVLFFGPRPHVGRVVWAERDEEHPYMPTPVRANQVTTTTPADNAKKAGANEGHPVNLN